jgi:[ribosomal protein S5]-alanine N-acetyltransferase
MSGLSSAPPRSKIPRLAELDLVLVTSRLRLRPIEEADAGDLWPYVADPQLPRMMSWAAHTDRSETLAFIRHVQAEHAAGTGITWAIEHDGRAVGCIGLDGIQYAMRAWRVDRAELGYWIAPPLWNKGLVTEAAHAVVRCGFDTIGLHKVTVSSFVENLGSRRVIEKLGFRAIGRSEDDVWRDGRWWSLLRYELTAGEWSDLSTTLRITRVARP